MEYLEEKGQAVIFFLKYVFVTFFIYSQVTETKFVSAVTKQRQKEVK